MAIDYSKYGLPSGANIDPASGAVMDANGNMLGHASEFGGVQGANMEWNAPSATYVQGVGGAPIMLQQGALDSIPMAGIGDFTTGAHALYQQGLRAGSSSLEGVPTVFTDEQGTPQYFYGGPSFMGNENVTDNGNNAWYKYSDLQPVQGIDEQGNQAFFTPTAATSTPSKYDTGALNRAFIGGNAMVLGSMLGAGALDAYLAGSGAAGLGGAEAFPVSMSDSITMSPLGASGVEAGSSGISASSLMRGLNAGGSLLSSMGSGAGGDTDSGGALPQQAAAGSGQTYGALNPSVLTNANTKVELPQFKELKQLYPQLSQVSPEILAILAKNNQDTTPVRSESPTATARDALAADLVPDDLKFAEGGTVMGEGGLPHVPEFITGATGHYVKGRGDGQSDDIPAMLADSEYVFDADTVSALGDGSSDAGANLLDEFRKSIREHKRSAPSDKIPPKASPLAYMKEALHRAERK